MKTCPVCRASCFEDMEICFECLHDFTVDDFAPDEAIAQSPQYPSACTYTSGIPDTADLCVDSRASSCLNDHALPCEGSSVDSCQGFQTTVDSQEGVGSQSKSQYTKNHDVAPVFEDDIESETRIVIEIKGLPRGAEIAVTK